MILNPPDFACSATICTNCVDLYVRIGSLFSVQRQGCEGRSSYRNIQLWSTLVAEEARGYGDLLFCTAVSWKDGYKLWIWSLCRCDQTSPSKLSVVIVSLPRGRIQEIKRMLLVHITHGLFLTWTQKSHYLQIIYYNIYTSFNAPLNLARCFLPFRVYLLYLENQLLCLRWRIPIHSCPWSANNCPTLC
jgi:hypothetical protein